MVMIVNIRMILSAKQVYTLPDDLCGAAETPEDPTDEALKGKGTLED